MSKQLRKIQRRMERCNVEATGVVTVPYYESGKRKERAAQTFSITPMNKLQRIVAGFVAPQHMHDNRVKNMLQGDKRPTNNRCRQKCHWRGKKRRKAA